MARLLSIIFLLFTSSNAFCESIINAATVSVSGYSNISSDKLTIYGGIAGTSSTLSGDGAKTADTCADPTQAVGEACNQNSVYAALKLSISFRLTKAVTAAKAKMFIESTSYSEIDGTSRDVTAGTGETVTLETTWAKICTNAGLSADCVGTSALFSSKGLKVGVDANGDGEVADDERKSFTIKFHYIPPSTTATQTYCSSTAAGAGVCKIVFTAGDQKVFIDSLVTAGADPGSGSFEFDSIAVFPVAATVGGESSIYSGFATSQATPIFKTINTDGSVPDSSVSGGLENYRYYCMVYGNRNKSGNIYNFVTTSIDTTTSCLTPSEVVGVLDDKHCFISTAAFGSESAPEVDTFRKFRNKFLLPNSFGKAFVKIYYKVSPAIANVISGNDFLKLLTRGFLYPFLLFSYLALQFGIEIAFGITLLLAIIARILIGRRKRFQRTALFLFVFLSCGLLKAEIEPQTETVTHPAAQEGLVRIKKDGTYVYDSPREARTKSSHLWIGQANYPDITVTVEGRNSSGQLDGSSTTFNFADFYKESSGVILGYDYEWYPYLDKGKIGYQAGFGMMFVTGSGKLVASPNKDSTESFTFVTVPLNFGGVYRFEWKDRQPIAPYIAGGGTYLALLEKREDISSPSFAGGLGFYGTAGALLNLGLFDADSGFQLESEYGIGNMWLSVEFKVIEVNSGAFSFSNSFVNAGLSFDF